MDATARLMCIVSAALVMFAGALCAASELRAGPWPRRSAGQEAYVAYYKAVEAEEAGDTAEAVALWRAAVRLGNVDSAFRLAELYFPSRGSFGNEHFSVQPSLLDGFVWLAIGIAGLDEEGDLEGRSRRSMEESLALMERLMTPLERQRAAEVLAAWPESLPPERTVRVIDEDRPYENATEFTAALMRFLNDDGTDEPRNLFRTDETIHQEGFEEMLRRAEAGDDDAAFAVAWCRVFGLGTEEDSDAALPHLRDLAEKGDGRALLALGQIALGRDADAAADRHFLHAAEAGNSHAMLALSSRAGQQGDTERRKEWAARSAEAGNVEAVLELVSIAETDRDVPGLLRWLATYAIAREGTAAGYRARLLLATFAEEDDDDALRTALEAGERWTLEHGGK